MSPAKNALNFSSSLCETMLTVMHEIYTQSVKVLFLTGQVASTVYCSPKMVPMNSIKEQRNKLNESKLLVIRMPNKGLTSAQLKVI